MGLYNVWNRIENNRKWRTKNMTVKEAKEAYNNRKMVQHMEDENICNYIS